MAVYTQYKGKGEHSVYELEKIMAEREEELHLIRSNQCKIVSNYDMEFILPCLQVVLDKSQKVLQENRLGDIDRKNTEETHAKVKELIEKYRD